MNHTLAQEGQRPWAWLLAAEKWWHKGCTGGRVWRWRGPWELQGVVESRQEQVLVREMTTQRDDQ